VTEALTHRPFNDALAAPVRACVPGFEGDWSTALRAVLRRMAVVAWKEHDVRRDLEAMHEMDRRQEYMNPKLRGILAEMERLQTAASICRAQLGDSN
jgi:hypothetical protein